MVTFIDNTENTVAMSLVRKMSHDYVETTETVTA
jgi:hypothetical protein